MSAGVLTPVLLLAGVLQSALWKNPIFALLRAVLAQRAHAETASGRAQKTGEPLMGLPCSSVQQRLDKSVLQR